MPEIGLVQLAKTALKVTQAVLPKHRTRFSKKQFTQPQLLALLCVASVTKPTHSEISNGFEKSQWNGFNLEIGFMITITPASSKIVCPSTTLFASM